MPQMAPILWPLFFSLFALFLVLTLIKLFFNILRPLVEEKDILKVKYNSKPWKW